MTPSLKRKQKAQLVRVLWLLTELMILYAQLFNLVKE